MTPKWLHVVALPDGEFWFSLNQLSAIEHAERHGGQRVKIALECAWTPDLSSENKFTKRTSSNNATNSKHFQGKTRV